MEQFSLEKWLKDKSRKVVTRDGRNVFLSIQLCPNEYYPVMGMVEGDKDVKTWTNEGINVIAVKKGAYDLFFADEKKTDKILDELKSYLKNTPKEQVEKDWKEIQDWYTQHFTNEKHNEEEELTEFEKRLKEILYEHATTNSTSEQKAKQYAPELLDLARKEIEKENSEFKPKFTYNEKDYSELANKLIEFRNNTPLCSVSYRDGEGRNVILHYEKEIFELVKNEILKDLPKWRDSWSTDDSTKPQIIGDCLVVGDNLIHISDLVNKLPKEE